MPESYLVLTPLLVLALVLLIRFIGCDLVFVAEGSPLTAPTDVRAVGGDGQVSLTWFQPSGQASGYTIHHGTTSGAYPNTLALTGGGDGQHTGVVTGLVNGTRVFFKVQANRGSEGSLLEDSVEVSVTPGLISFVTTQVLGQTGSGFVGRLGMQLQVLEPTTIVALGRMAAVGNSGMHVVRLVRPIGTGGEDTASVVVNTLVPDQPRFVYGLLPTPMLVLPNERYYLVSDEVSGGDVSHDVSTTVQTTGVAAVLGGVQAPDVPAPMERAYAPQGGPSQTFGPVSFQYVEVSSE